MFPLKLRKSYYKKTDVPPELNWLKIRMDYTTWIFIAGTATLCSGVLWIGTILNNLQLSNERLNQVNITKNLKDQVQDNNIQILLKREEVNRTLLQTIVTKLTILETRIK